MVQGRIQSARLGSVCVVYSSDKTPTSSLHDRLYTPNLTPELAFFIRSLKLCFLLQLNLVKSLVKWNFDKSKFVTITVSVLNLPG